VVENDIQDPHQHLQAALVPVITVDVAALECRRVRSRYVIAFGHRALFLGIADERMQVVADDHLHGGSCQ
jgi:hypothetical protein